MKPRCTSAHVDLGALRANYHEARRLSRGAAVCAVVKADAYGHGALAVSKALEKDDVDFLAVAFIEEALELRAGGIVTPILNFGSSDPANADILVSENISQTVYTADLARALASEASARGTKAKIHVKIDTGMHRQGVAWEDSGRFARFLQGLGGLEVEGVYSHFAESDAEDKNYSLIQIQRFESAIGAMKEAGISPRIAHISNSSAILGLPQARFDMVRSGIILYGLSPDGSCDAPEGFEPVMSLRSRIVNLRDVKTGEGLSYGRTFQAARDTKVALIQVGYADGYPRILSNRAQVLVRGKRAPVAGRICMDQTLLDVTDIPEAELGDEVILFGTRELPAGELSALAETIDYEITCGISQRVPRLYEE